MRFLVVRTDFLGDSVLSSSFVRMLSTLPGITIDVMCFEYNFAAFKYNPVISEKYYLYETPNSIEQSLANEKTLNAISQINYTATFMLNRSLKAYKLLKYINCNKIFGHKLGIRSIRSKIFCKWTSLSKKYNYLPYDNSIHEVVNLWNLLKFGLDVLRLDKDILLDPHCYFYTDNFNPELPSKRDENVVVVNISGRYDTVRYIPSSLAWCIIYELLQYNFKILIIATSDDAGRAKSLISDFDPNKVELCVEADLFKVANKMAKYLYYIGADGGLLHIAAGLNMHCIGLFHAQNINSWHAWTSTQITLQTPSKRIYDLTAKEIIHALQQLQVECR